MGSAGAKVMQRGPARSGEVRPVGRISPFGRERASAEADAPLGLIMKALQLRKSQ
jgi:hypothetical protein